MRWHSGQGVRHGGCRSAPAYCARVRHRRPRAALQLRPRNRDHVVLRSGMRVHTELALVEHSCHLEFGNVRACLLNAADGHNVRSVTAERQPAIRPTERQCLFFLRCWRRTRALRRDEDSHARRRDRWRAPRR
ncbi:MAG: hypothetical protein AMJ84_00485 [Acidithiobacillales bacterium SM23_46]|nr:MAG: hypothetical protein AMJ84_00485 [Acidithiobacillales bacterium SM23_46]